MTKSDNAEIRRLKKSSPSGDGRMGFFEQRQLISGSSPTCGNGIIRYIDTYRDQLWVELICRLLGDRTGGFMNRCGYRLAKTRELSNSPIRDRFARILKIPGLSAVKRRRTPLTTKTRRPDSSPLDKVHRWFVSDRLIELWTADKCVCSRPGRGGVCGLC